jgi:hypothetical protein
VEGGEELEDTAAHVQAEDRGEGDDVAEGLLEPIMESVLDSEREGLRRIQHLETDGRNSILGGDRLKIGKDRRPDFRTREDDADGERGDEEDRAEDEECESHVFVLGDDRALLFEEEDAIAD